MARTTAGGSGWVTSPTPRSIRRTAGGAAVNTFVRRRSSANREVWLGLRYAALKRGRPSGRRGRGERRRVGPRVTDGEHLPQVAVCVLPVDVLAAEAPVDLHVVIAAGPAPVGEARPLDAGEDRVKVGVADTEAQMIALELSAIGEVEGQGFVDVDRRELPAALLPRHRQQIGEQLRRFTAPARRNDDVIELDGHHAPPRYCFFRRISSQGDVK